jgi:HemY protein
MIRVLIFLVIVFGLGLAFAWLADRPGEMVITFGGYEYQLTLLVAALLGVALVAAAMVAWWVLKGIWNSPRSVGRYFRARRRDRGYQALSTGLIAAGAGDSGLARRMSKQAEGQLSADQEPLLHLLDAQTLMLEGRHDAARAKFEAMTADPETRLLGLRGLYLEARRLGEHEAARHYAEEAAGSAPQLVWATNAAISARVIEQDFEGALKLASSQDSVRRTSRSEADNRRAVLLTGKAMALIDQDPAAARAAAIEANRLAPDFVPAIAIAGRALFRNDEIRKGMRLLEAAWKKNPHPDIAAAYVHARPGDSTHDRLKRARRLESLNPDHVESALAVARAALEAGEYGAARQAAEAAIRLDPRESAFLLLADIEEAETGDEGRVRQWLARAVRAPRDPAWTADGHVSERWAAASPVTGAIGAFEWRVPVERIGSVIEASEPAPVAPVAAVVEVEQQTAAMPSAGAPGPGEAQVPDSGPAVEREEPASARGKADAGAAAMPMPPIPDDPGVEDEERPAPEPGRFRLF